MAAPKYLEYDSTSGDIKQLAATESGPAAEVVVATDAGGTVDLTLLPSALALKADVQSEAYEYAADTGTANAYAVTLSPVPTIVAGSKVVFLAAHTNTTASTLAVNGGSATGIEKESASGLVALVAGDIQAGQIVTVIFDGAQWQIANPVTGTGSDTDTLAGDTDVLISSPADGDLLRYNSGAGKWGNVAIVNPYDLFMFIPGKPAAGQYAIRNNFTRSVIFPAGLTNSQPICGTAPTGSVTLTINKNGVSVGTISFAGGATTGSFTFASPVTFALGDRMSLTMPNPQDATFADIGLTFAGTR